jgi:hypothetical protein
MSLFNRLFISSNKMFSEEINKAIELNPYCPEDYVNQGDLKSDLKEYRSVIQDYNIAIELNP